MSAAAAGRIQIPHFKNLEVIHDDMSSAQSGTAQSIFRQCLQFQFMFLNFSLIIVVKEFFFSGNILAVDDFLSTKM